MVKIGRGGETAGGRVLGVAFIFLGFNETLSFMKDL